MFNLYRGDLVKMDKMTYLKTSILQQDMRIRMPKCIIENMNVKQGETEFDVYISENKDALILKINDEKSEN